MSRPEATSVRRVNIAVAVTVLMLVGVPAYAYGDPTGGALFQVLMPALAALWGIWLIFANKLRRGVGALVRKLRGTSPEEQSAE
jgi:hypothetical protein